MRPYGLKIIQWPDMGDIKEMASKSSVGKLPSKSGEYRSYFRSAAAKRITRRLWKRRARLDGRRQCTDE